MEPDSHTRQGTTRFENSFDGMMAGAGLVADAVALFGERPSLLVYPLVGILVSFGIGLGGAAMLALLWTTTGLAAGVVVLLPVILTVIVGTYLSIAFANTFFLAALIHEVYDHHHGIDLSLVAGMGAAARQWWPLFLWAMINWTIGRVFRRSNDDGGPSQRLLGETVRLGWTAATFFVIPVILFEEARGRDMFQKSARHFRDSWEQILAAVVGIRLLGYAIGAVGGALGGLFFLGDIAIIAVPVAVFFGVVAFVVTTTLQGVIKATVYEYLTAADHDVTEVLPEERRNAETTDPGVGVA